MISDSCFWFKRSRVIVATAGSGLDSTGARSCAHHPDAHVSRSAINPGAGRPQLQSTADSRALSTLVDTARLAI